MKNQQPHEKKDRNTLLFEYYSNHHEKMSLAQIGKVFGISRQRVSQLIQRIAKQAKETSQR